MRVPTPKLRLKRKRQRTVESGISVEQALQSLYGVFQKQLKTIIIKVLEDKPEKKPTKKLQQQSEKQKQEKKMKKQHQLREEMEKADRIPRTSFEQVDAMLNAAQGTARKVLASEYPGAGQIGTLWREYARANFDDAVEQAKNEIEERVETEEEGSSVAVVETNDSEGQEDIVRTCSVRLPAILRDDLNDEVKQMFLDAVAETSEQATDYVAELGTVMHATMLKYAAGSVTLDPSSKAATYHQDNSKVFNVLDVLSEESVRNPEVLNSDSTTPAAPLPENESTYLKALPKKSNDEFINLFSEAHLQFLHSSCFGRQRYKASVKTFWSALRHPMLKDLPRPPTGLSTVMHFQLKQYAINLQNMWAGGLFLKSINNLLRILLRINLAPEREQEIRETSEKKAKEKEKQREESSKHMRGKKQWHRRKIKGRIKQERKNLQRLGKRLACCYL